MKKIVILSILIGFGYYYFQNKKSDNSLSVTELINSNSKQENVTVTGKVTNNFKLFYGIYEMTDINTGESIMVSTNKELPKIGSIITKKLMKKEMMTVNDKTISLFHEIE